MYLPYICVWEIKFHFFIYARYFSNFTVALKSVQIQDQNNYFFSILGSHPQLWERLHTESPSLAV